MNIAMTVGFNKHYYCYKCGTSHPMEECQAEDKGRNCKCAVVIKKS